MDRKTIVFAPLNSPGHINSCLGIADRLKDEFQCRTVFLIIGETMGKAIQEHQHELYPLEELNVWEDYEVSDSEDLSEPQDPDELAKRGKPKRQFSGCLKWPQIILRNKWLFQLSPLESFVKSAKLMEGLMVDELLTNHHLLEEALLELKPDLVVIDHYFVPPCIIKLAHIPWVRLYSANPLGIMGSRLEGGLKPFQMMGFQLWNKQVRARMRQEEPHRWEAVLAGWRETMQQVVAAMGEATGPLAAFMLENGLEPPPPGQQALDSPHLNLYMFPQAIDYDQDDDLFEVPERWFRCDSLIRKATAKTCAQEAAMWDQRIREAMQGEDGRQAIVLFSLGSLASGDVRTMRRFVSMLANDQKRLYVVAKGVNGDKYELDPSNMIGSNYIPQTHILQKAQLAIIHGGNNSITECLYFGLPCIVLPVFADQLDNAQRIEDMGLGKRLDVHNCTWDQLSGAIEDILGDQAMLDKARKLGEEMRARNDAVKICRMLKKLLDDGQLEQSYIDKCRTLDARDL